MKSIPTKDPSEGHWNVIIETPKGSSNKYKFEEKLSLFSLSGVLPEGMAFPYDFGYLPSTLGEDGDPLDVLLLMDQPTFAGCLVPSRLIGIIEGEQTERDGTTQRNDRLLGIAIKSRRYKHVRSMNDLDPDLIKEIGKFFIHYNEIAGKKFKVLNTFGSRRAESNAEQGMKQFAKPPKRSRTRK